ncbi:MAG TPA: DedA family protein [Candidatus Saccharimonadales bacterium]
MLDVSSSISGASVIGALLLIGVIVWAESGLLIGLLLPGDTLLFIAGFYVADGHLPWLPTLLVIFIGAILGDNTGYFFGKKTGPRIFRKDEGIFFRKDQLERAEAFYEKHGGKTVMGARMIPYARTLVPIISGISQMRRSKFITFNVIGALLWTLLFVGLGYVFGVEVAKQIERYALPAFIISLLTVVSPGAIYLVRNKAARARLLAKLRRKTRE